MEEFSRWFSHIPGRRLVEIPARIVSNVIRFAGMTREAPLWPHRNQRFGAGGQAAGTHRAQLKIGFGRDDAAHSKSTACRARKEPEQTACSAENSPRIARRANAFGQRH
jgi:hypothetical protein